MLKMDMAVATLYGQLFAQSADLPLRPRLSGQMFCFQTTSSRSCRLRQPSEVRVIEWW